MESRSEFYELNVCRVCIKKKKKYFSLYELHEKSTLGQKIMSVAQVQIVENDGFPNVICEDCRSDLLRAVKFKDKCELSDRLLRLSSFDIKCEEVNENDDERSDNDYESSPKNYFKMELTDTIKEPKISAQSDDHKVNTELHNAITLQSNSTNGDEYDDDKYQQNISNSDIPTSLNHLGKPKQEILDNAKDIKVKRHINDILYKCNKCRSIFKTFSETEEHLKNVHKKKSEKLHITEIIKDFSKDTYNVGPIFAGSHDKQLSQEQHNVASTMFSIKVDGTGSSRLFSCSMCNYKTKHIAGINMHKKSHTGERPWTCSHCPKSYVQKSKLLEHIEVHHKEPQKISCKICAKICTSKVQLATHMKSHALGNFECDICKAVLKTKKTLTMHLIRHSDTKTFTCEKCGDSFYTNSELCSHRRKHDVNKLPRHKCNKCNWRVHDLAKFRKHVQKHDSKKPFCCDKCGRFFQSTQLLESHKKLHLLHHKCEYCLKNFIKSNNLSKHIANKHRLGFKYVKLLN